MGKLKAEPAIDFAPHVPTEGNLLHLLGIHCACNDDRPRACRREMKTFGAHVGDEKIGCRTRTGATISHGPDEDEDDDEEHESILDEENFHMLGKRRRRSFHPHQTTGRRRPPSAATTTASVIYCNPHYHVLLSLLPILLALSGASQILCDTQAASTETGAIAPPTTTTGTQQRFFEGPKDATVLLGQSISLDCSVENKNGILEWLRGDSRLGDEKQRIIPLYARLGYSWLPSQSMVSNETRDSSAAADGLADSVNNLISINATKASSPRTNMAKYTLHISKVSLDDDAKFFCSVIAADSTSLSSRPGRLTVLQPPSRLEIIADSPDNLDMQSSPFEKVQNRDDYLARNDVDTASDGQIRVIRVRQNSRLRLECRSDSAKPHPELVWLNDKMEPVPNSGVEDIEDGSNPSSFAQKKVQSDAKEPRLEATTVIWSFQVQRHHNDQLFTCQAKHPAFDMKLAGLRSHELRRQIRLDVQFAPDVELTKEPASLYENRAAIFRCQARGKPNQLTYSWFIDDQLIMNATEPELYVERVSRQLHGRQLKCKATNSIGYNTSTMMLSVRYSPAYVTHLLPAHLQPQSEMTLSHQLAQGFERRETIPLRCDFDSNPAVTQVEWYKIDAGYGSMINVTPSRADDLIAGGMVGAIFADEPPEYDRLTSGGSQNNKRHISSTLGGNSLGLADLDSTFYGGIVRAGDDTLIGALNYGQVQLDYERMSMDILDQLQFYLLKDERQQQLHQDDGFRQVVRRLPAPPPTQSHRHIREPLSWRLVANNDQSRANKRRVHNYQQLHQRAAHLLGQHHQVAATISDVLTPTAHLEANGDFQQQGGAPTLLLEQPGGQLDGVSAAPAAIQLSQRRATLASSTIELRNAKEEDAGKYICVGRSSSGAGGSHASLNEEPMARAIYLVMKRRPRLVSVQEQFATPGAHTVQLECLAEVNADINNQTAISWSRAGKPVEAIQKLSHERGIMKNYTTYVELSPDFLFMRSKLLIQGVDAHDFGRYRCTITDPRYQADSIDIQLRESDIASKPFTIMASLVIGAILVVVCLFALIIVCAPPTDGRLASKLGAKMDSHMKGKQTSPSPKDSNGTSTTGAEQVDSDRKSPRSSDSGHEEGSISDLPAPPMQAQLQQYVNYQNSESPSLQNHHNNRLRSSLRQPAPVVGLQRSGKFAAIHESLEHKLQLSRTEVLMKQQQQHGDNNSTADHNNLGTMADMTDDHQRNCRTVSKLDDQPNTLLDKLWSRILLKRNKDAAASAASTTRRVGSGRAKSRPIISMPLAGSINGVGLNLKRSSLSTSLSMLTNSNEFGRDGAKGGDAKRPSDNNQMSVMTHHTNDTHLNCSSLLSSSVNLIQDSTTASDGSAASSGRSSSTSNGGARNQRPFRQTGVNEPDNGSLLTNQQQQVDFGSPNLSYMQRSMWMAPQTSRQVEHPMNAAADYYAAANMSYHHQTSDHNAHISANQAQHLLHYGQAQASPSAYASPAAAAGLHLNTGSQVNYNPTWVETGQQQLMPTEHYQLSPIVMPQAAEFSASVAQQCNYATLPSQKSPFNQLPMVQTSDAGDAYFESNYGTMLSRASAYQTLGYGSQTISFHNPRNQSNTSSPNSMITHANHSSTTAIELVTDKPASNATSTTTVTPTSTKTTISAADQVNASNGLATHV